MEIPSDLEKCIEFHGHLCPGVVIGYSAAKLAMRELSVSRSSDEELIAIVENDSCAVDAIQVLTGCTFGKGNLFCRDYGKMVFTFATRRDKRSVRLYYNCNTIPARNDNLSDEANRQNQTEFMLSHSPEEFFDVKQNQLSCLPDNATIYNSLPCDQCGELVMEPRLQKRGGKLLCISCYKK